MSTVTMNNTENYTNPAKKQHKKDKNRQHWQIHKSLKYNELMTLNLSK